MYRETSVKDIVDVREELSNERLNIVPFVPNPPISWRYDESFAHGTGSPWVTGYQRQSRSREPHAAAFLDFESLRYEVKEEVVVKLATEVALSLLKATDVVVRYLANSAEVECTPTECTLTMDTVNGESLQIKCSMPMLEAARVGLERLNLSVTSCMANPVGTSRMTAGALADRLTEYGLGAGECEVSFQDFDAVPLYPSDLMERTRAGTYTEADANTVADGITEVVDRSKTENIQRVVVDTVSRVETFF